jgi:hypothetical protein
MRTKDGCLVLTVVALLALTSLDACASDRPYNPDAIPAARLAGIQDICVHVLGLNPRESPVGGVYRGAPHLDPGVNHYQTCVASLSDSWQRVENSRIVHQADQACRSRGLPADTAQFALCVLDSTNTKRSNETAPDAVPTSATIAAAAPVTSNFFLDSAGVTRRKEETACALLGLEPGGGEFANCVKLLHDNFYAIDNTIE